MESINEFNDKPQEEKEEEEEDPEVADKQK